MEMVWNIGKILKYGVWGVVWVVVKMTKYGSVESRKEGSIEKGKMKENEKKLLSMESGG
jgi:hypothetical protein